MICSLCETGVDGTSSSVLQGRDKPTVRTADTQLSVSGSLTFCLFTSFSSWAPWRRLLSHTCSKCTTKVTVTHANNNYNVLLFSVSPVGLFPHLLWSVAPPTLIRRPWRPVVPRVGTVAVLIFASAVWMNTEVFEAVVLWRGGVTWEVYLYLYIYLFLVEINYNIKIESKSGCVENGVCCYQVALRTNRQSLIT